VLDRDRRLEHAVRTVHLAEPPAAGRVPGRGAAAAAGTRRGAPVTAARVAVVVPSLAAGGAERVARDLAGRFAGTAAVTVVTYDPRLSRRALAGVSAPPWADRVPPGCGHVHLAATGRGM